MATTLRDTPAGWWVRLGVRVQNLWGYRLWNACKHPWLLTLDEQGFARWLCADCLAHQR